MQSPLTAVQYRTSNIRYHRRITILVLTLATIITNNHALAYDDNALIRLAHDAVSAEVKHGAPPRVEWKSSPLPVFVTIEIGGKVVGCRGSLVTRTRSLEDEVVLAARAAAMHDPRYRPLTEKDSAACLVTVTIVERLEPIASVDGLSPSDGLVLKAGNRTGVVLPWEGKDPSVRLRWAYRKAGVPPGTPCGLQRLKGERYRG